MQPAAAALKNDKLSAPKRRKNKKKPFLARMADRGREFLALGKVLVNEPKSFPSAVMTLAKNSLRTVWDARGGGLYACGFVVSFVWLEISMLASEFAESSGLAGFLGGQLVELLLRFTVESMVNTIRALLWPFALIGFQPPKGMILFVVLYLLFPRYLKPPLERLLFTDTDEEQRRR